MMYSVTYYHNVKMKKCFTVNEWTVITTIYNECVNWIQFVLNEKMITTMCILRKRCSIWRRKCFNVNGFFLIGICTQENKIKICIGIYNFVLTSECLCYCIG